MRQETPSYEAIVDTLHWAARGYVIGPGEAVRPMPWRQILGHLSGLGRNELLCIDPSANGTGSGIAVGRIAADGRSGAANGPRETTWAMDTRDGSRAVAQFAQRIEMAVRSGKYRSVTCMRRGSMIFAVTTGASAPFVRSNGADRCRSGEAAMFDLEAALRDWRARMERKTALSQLEVDELEDHLRARIDLELELDGALTPARAFSLARHDLGEPTTLSREFAKAGKPR
ncbi:hypothetical protein [Candidatus Palauibacter sp.]|uniref:hypothetical protein n=1 Tax=Candidatus Palauibacter sp. TaxID=3101350 RepID=UPI003B5B15A5